MSRQIEMNEIPFAPLLGDTIPPTVKPRDPLPVARPKRHTVIAWRHDGGLDHASFETLELARDHVGKLHFTVYYKWVLMAGTRDFVARGDIDLPGDMDQNELAYRVFCRDHGLTPTD